MNNEPVLKMVEVEGTLVREVLSADKRIIDPNIIIKELNDIINQKNAVIEQQTEYIADLQNENYHLRSTVKMLTI